MTQVDQSGAYFYIDDGSELKDDTKTGGVDNIGVRVAFDGRAYAGRFVTITGISSSFKGPSGKLLRLIRVSSADDIKAL